MNQTAAAPDAVFEARRGDYTLTTDRRRIDIATVHHFLSRDTYWARDVPLATVQRAFDHSLPFAAFAPDGTMAAFGRLVTDYAVFAYVRDVFCLPEHRGRGLASWMAQEIRNHPALATVSTWMLSTRDAHTVYERAGYRRVTNPDDYMRLVTRPAEAP